MSVETILEHEIRTELVVENVGPRGRAGRDGAGGSAHDHRQTSASTEWTIAHNLGFRPSVTTTSLGGIPFAGDVAHLSDDVLVVRFLLPVAGLAHLV